MIQAIYRGADTCTSCSYLNCTEDNFVTNASDSQDISHLPKNSAFCFVAIAIRNASKIIQLGTFNTEAGTITGIILYAVYYTHAIFKRNILDTCSCDEFDNNKHFDHNHWYSNIFILAVYLLVKVQTEEDKLQRSKFN